MIHKEIPVGYAPIRTGQKPGEYLVGSDNEIYEKGSWGVNIFDVQEGKYFTNCGLHLEVTERCAILITASEIQKGHPIFMTDAANAERYLIATRRVKSLYLIHVEERFIDVDATALFSRKYCYPVIVHTAKGEPVPLNYYTTTEITDVASFDFQTKAQGHLIGIRDWKATIINKETEEEALASLKTEWPKRGGDIGAIWRMEGKAIRHITCGNMHLLNTGSVVCGRPEIVDIAKNREDGLYGSGCIIDQYAPGPNCPLDPEREESEEIRADVAA